MPTNKKLEEEFDKIYESGFYIRNKLKDFIHTNYIPREEVEELIKKLQIKISEPNSEYINKLPQIQILDELIQKLNSLK